MYNLTQHRQRKTNSTHGIDYFRLIVQISS
jgi:hypothetical protein